MRSPAFSPCTVGIEEKRNSAFAVPTGIEKRPSWGAEYPDRGASADVYTNADPKKYVELETLGPLAPMKPGHRISQTNTYRFFRRTPNSRPETEARRLLAPRTSR